MHKDYRENLVPRVWQNLSLEQRTRTLQDLENDHARQLGREPFKVQPVQMQDLTDCGEMVYSEKLIKINEQHLKQDNLMCYAIHTTLHEGRHAYQHTAIRDKSLHRNKDEVELWQINSQTKIPFTDKTYLLYRLQPLERDADAYANIEFSRLAMCLEQSHGKLDKYRFYKRVFEADIWTVIQDAKNRYGRNVINDIATTIRKVHQMEQGQTPQRKAMLKTAYLSMDKDTALKNHPELKGLYEMEAAAHKLADKRIGNQDSRAAYVAAIRERGLDELANGRHLPQISRQGRAMTSQQMKRQAHAER